MMPKKPAPDLISGGYRFSENIMLKQQPKRDADPNKRHDALARCGEAARSIQPATSASTALTRTSARRDSCHSRNSPEATTTAEPIRRPMVGTSPQMAKPKITAHTSER